MHNFRTLRGDFSHKIVHRWNEDIILGHIIHILDVLLARTGCCRRLTDSNPAWTLRSSRKSGSAPASCTCWLRSCLNTAEPKLHGIVTRVPLRISCMNFKSSAHLLKRTWRHFPPPVSLAIPRAGRSAGACGLTCAPCGSPGANCCCNRSATKICFPSTPVSTPRATARNGRSVPDEHRVLRTQKPASVMVLAAVSPVGFRIPEGVKINKET